MTAAQDPGEADARAHGADVPGAPDAAVAIQGAPAAGGAFWREKRLDEMTPDEWESLCDGCGLCCLEKLEDWFTGEITYTDVACRLLDTRACRCKSYETRQTLVPDCQRLTADNVASLRWLPGTCAYRLLAEGRDLPEWHYLVSGDPGLVHRRGISARGRAVPAGRAGRWLQRALRQRR